MTNRASEDNLLLAKQITAVNRELMQTVKSFIEAQETGSVGEGLRREKAAFHAFAAKELKS